MFKGIVIFVFICVLSMLSVMPVMILALVGPGGIAILAAIKLLNWENEVTHSSFKWDRVQLIFMDRQQMLVVLQRRYDPEIPLEKNYMYFEVFLPKNKIDDFLKTCKEYAPLQVDFEEGHCECRWLWAMCFLNPGEAHGLRESLLNDHTCMRCVMNERWSVFGFTGHLN